MKKRMTALLLTVLMLLQNIPLAMAADPGVACSHEYQGDTCVHCGMYDPMFCPGFSDHATITAACPLCGFYCQHDWQLSDWGKQEPTCTKPGTVRYDCYCGFSKDEPYAPATGHSYVNGACSTCGQRDPDYVPAANQCGDDAWWSFDASTGTLTISGSSRMYDYENVDGKRAPWIIYDTQIKKLVMEADDMGVGVTSIGDYAFYGCTELEETDLHVDVHDIGEGAFGFCVSMTEFESPGMLGEIGERAFAGCGSLRTVTYNGTSIKPNAFDGCGLIQTIYYLFDECCWNVGMQEDRIESGNDALLNADIVFLRPDPGHDYENGVCYRCGAADPACTHPDGPPHDGWGADRQQHWLVCNRCNEEYSREAHNIVEYSPCYGVCETCGHGYVLDGPHDWASPVQHKDPTCTEEGEAIYYCNAACNVYKTEPIPALEHCYEDGSCARCGEADPDYVPSMPASGTCGANLKWNFDASTGTLTISGTGGMEDYPVSGGNSTAPWSDYIGSIVAVVVEKGVASIGAGAFANCIAIQSADLSEGLTEIGLNAFAFCSALKSVDLPDGLATIGQSAFYKCKALTSITIPGSVTFFGSDAFSCDDALAAVVVEEGVTVISDRAFSYCFALEEVTLPSTLTTIGESAFRQCAFSSIDLPESVKTIENYAFIACSSLATVNYGGTAEDRTGISIGSSGNDSLLNAAWNYSAIVEGDCGDDVRWSYDKTNAILTISGSGEMYDYRTNTVPWNDFRYEIQTIVVEEGVTSICDYMLDCSDVAYDPVSYAFETLHLPSTLKRIGSMAFAYSGLRDVTLPEGLEIIKDNAFAMTGLERITIPSTVHTIETIAFQYCNLREVTFLGAAPTSFANDVFEGCDYVTLYADASKGGWMDDYDPSAYTWKGYSMVLSNIPLMPPGCEHNYVDGTCIHCGAADPDYVPVCDHSWDDGVVTTPADCVNEGVKTYTCMSCGETRTEALSAKGHESDGCSYSNAGDQHWFVCKNCYQSYGYENHNYVEYAPCVGYCGVCGHTKMLGGDHVWEIMFDSTHHWRYCSPCASEQEYETHIGTFPSCTEAGWCAVCEYPMPAKGHNFVNGWCWDCAAADPDYDFTCDHIWADGIVTKESTCTESGVMTYTCYSCGETKMEILSAAGHTSCEGTYAADPEQHWSTCAVCLTPYNYETHSYVDVSACMKHCEECYYMMPLDGEHTWDGGIVITAPTCAETGEMLYTCTACGFGVTKTEIIPKLDHTADGSSVTTVPPTCTEDGVETIYCTVCGEVVAEESSPALGHSYTDGICERCGAADPDYTCPHNTVEWEPGYPATCTDPGLTDKGYCGDCNEVFAPAEPIPALGHDEAVSAGHEPTCENRGSTELRYCRTCHEIFVQRDIIPALGHEEVIDAAVAPTCDANGLTEGKHCERCGKVSVAQEVLPLLGHKIVIDEAVSATCTATGLTAGKHCSICSRVVVKQEVVPVLDHNWMVTEESIEPSCTTDGEWCYVCTGCGAEKREFAWSLDHADAISDPGTPPTCTETGFGEGFYCSRCGEWLIEPMILPALGHTEVIDEAMDATCTETGLTEGKHCSVCDTVLAAQQTVPARGHVYDDKQDASCNTCGAIREVEELKSSVSGRIKNSRGAKVTLTGGIESYESETMGDYQFTGVSLGEYDLSVKEEGCLTYTVRDISVNAGEVILPEIELLRGDINGDDMINARDINGFRREFGKSGDDVGNTSADLNGDDMVNARDINVLRRNFGKSAKDCIVQY